MNPTRQSGIEIHDLKTRASLFYDAFFVVVSHICHLCIRQLLMTDFFFLNGMYYVLKKETHEKNPFA